jgi:D-cysteine desulfhydrase
MMSDAHRLLAEPDDWDRAHPRVTLAHLPTPVEPLDRLGRVLGLAPGRLLAKRDDATGLALGGNKVRKLEYLCAEALIGGARHLVTAGLAQSNHGRQTSAAAAKLGMGCTLLFDEEPPATFSGNLVLDTLFGATLQWITARNSTDVDYLEPEIRAEAARITAAGVPAYPVTVGGSVPLGALGYVRAAFELRDQVRDLAVVFGPSGSGGTHAGLAAGLGDYGLIQGVRIGDRLHLADKIVELATEAASLAGLPEPVGRPRVDDRWGAVAHSEAVFEAIVLAARTEGLVLDPVYTGKVMAGLIAAAREGSLPGEGSIVFLHTGGGPGLLSAGHSAWLVGELGAARGSHDGQL